MYVCMCVCACVEQGMVGVYVDVRDVRVCVLGVCGVCEYADKGMCV